MRSFLSLRRVEDVLPVFASVTLNRPRKNVS